MDVTRHITSQILTGHVLTLTLCLPGFGVVAGDLAAADRPEPLPEVPDRQLYVSGIVGSSLGVGGEPKNHGWIGDLASPTVGGDAALGVSVPRPKGAVRIELEGRTRPRAPETATGDEAASSTDWSTMANLWRDVPITDHLGAYAGGGIGVGGHRDAEANRATGFTWQVGGGVTYAVNDRVTFDVGYRGLPAAFGDAASGPATGELLLSVRLYDPLRGWLR
jgi:opacity protein-like surface antigen